MYTRVLFSSIVYFALPLDVLGGACTLSPEIFQPENLQSPEWELARGVAFALSLVQKKLLLKKNEAVIVLV